MARKAVFLDRDGVLTRERVDYVKTPEELEIFPGAFEPLRNLKREGFLLVVVTNQSVVGRGLATMDMMDRIHAKLRNEFSRHGCQLDAIYYCPHLPNEGCDCRKPQPGLILRAARDLQIDIQSCWMIGDKDIDLEAARRAGCRGLRVLTNSDGLAVAIQELIRNE